MSAMIRIPVLVFMHERIGTCSSTHGFVCQHYEPTLNADADAGLATYHYGGHVP